MSGWKGWAMAESESQMIAAHGQNSGPGRIPHIHVFSSHVRLQLLGSFGGLGIGAPALQRSFRHASSEGCGQRHEQQTAGQPRRRGTCNSPHPTTAAPSCGPLAALRRPQRRRQPRMTLGSAPGPPSLPLAAAHQHIHSASAAPSRHHLSASMSHQLCLWRRDLHLGAGRGRQLRQGWSRGVQRS